MGQTLHDHQLEALPKLSNGKVLVGDVGSGKSFVAAMYYAQNESPKPVYVITTAKKRDTHDWEQEFAHVGVGVAKNASLRGILTVDSWNNISNYVDVKDAFFIFDEQRLVGSGVWVSSFLKIVKHNRWIMLSATPGDMWLDFIPLFVANGFYKNRTEFKREHVIYNSYAKFPKVDRYVNVAKLAKYREQVLVEMAFVRKTKRKTEWVRVECDHEAITHVTTKRWNIYKQKPLRDISALFQHVREITNSDPSRLEAIRNILQFHDKLIIFYNFDYELEILRTLDGVTIAEWNGHKHEPIPKTDKWVYLVQYAAGAEGWNCIETNAMCFYSLTYSYRNWHQAMGRIDRLNTEYKDLYYYTLVSTSWIDLAVKRALLSKKSFNEKHFRKGWS